MFSLQSNIWKMWIYLFTHRRVYIPLLSLYFLTFPDSNFQQIGIYMGIGALAGFLFEIPSGYFSDYFGHRKTLIFGKICMVISSLLFVYATHLRYFIAGSIFLALGQAFASGAHTAFMHETLEGLDKDKHFTKIWGRIGGTVSLANAGLVIGLPFLTQIDFILPFKVGLGLDSLGLIIALLLVATPREKKKERQKKEQIFEKKRLNRKKRSIKTVEKE